MNGINNKLFKPISVDYRDYITLDSSIVESVSDINCYKIGNLVFLQYDISIKVSNSDFNNGVIVVGTCSGKIKTVAYGSSRVTLSNKVYPATCLVIPNGQFRIMSTPSNAYNSAGSVLFLAND